jgi:hypothetical protein
LDDPSEKGKLDKRQIKLLEAIPNWTWSVLDKMWEDGYTRTLKYGFFKVRVKTKDGFNLGSWQFTKRQDYKKGKLSPEKVKLLEAIPGWTWDEYEDLWQQNFKLSKKHGKLPIKFKTKDGFWLGGWQQKQRVHYNKGSLSEERVKLLETIPNWTWETMGVVERNRLAWVARRANAKKKH